MMIFTLNVFVIYLNVNILWAADLLRNPDFERRNRINPWVCQGCQASVEDTSYHGDRSVEVTNRLKIYSGLVQSFNVEGGKHIKCRAFIKLLNLPHGKMSAKVTMMSIFTTDGITKYEVIGVNKYFQPKYGWTEIGGDLLIPQGTSRVKISIRVDDPSVNYLLDYSSCQYINHDVNWKTKANQRINNIRKGSLTISLASSEPFSTSGITVQIKQTKSKFAFGTAIKAALITDTSSTYKAYQDFVYNNFEWAVTENALKWKLMEKTMGTANYAKGVDAVNVLKAHGMKVRGHNMFWGVDGHSPAWLDGLSSTEILQQMHMRVNGMIAHTYGLLEHWDVNNENLHGDYFEQTTGHSDITREMFNWMHSLEPNVKLFLNDFNVVNSHLYTTAYKIQGRKFKYGGIPIYGMGVQSHFKTSQIDMNVLKYRLDKISQSGLPIWITELSILESNDVDKASALDDVMTLYFSHPAVEGVLLWGFWDGAINKQLNALATGDNVTPNAAGIKWMELFHQRFRTNELYSFDGLTSIDTRVFLGEHELLIKHNGNVIHTETIYVDQGGKTATVHLQGSGSSFHVSHVDLE
ncbi:anti-sigma-I factor RsgI6-like [Mytilus galloprovincialis]|uniref:anti-sigma-I factor RsgI6-like n=1 Tax=Mytilus galloprovincialis TaxID=29158 RepID=UPI003F7B9D88